MTARHIARFRGTPVPKSRVSRAAALALLVGFAGLRFRHGLRTGNARPTPRPVG